MRLREAIEQLTKKRDAARRRGDLHRADELSIVVVVLMKIVDV